MFRDAGHRTTTARTLGRSVNRANVVVWFPDRFSPPSKTTCDFFEQWLSEAPGRTLVYVGRDYHVDVAYWRRINDEALATPDTTAKRLYDLRRWYARSRADEQDRDSFLRKSESCKWFQLDRDVLPHDAKELSGPWAAQVAGAKYPPVVSTRWTLLGIQPQHAQSLLASGDEILITKVSRPHWRRNRLILVANSSMFLNLPLVDRANQAVARKMIAECGIPGRTVFLTSGNMDPPVAGAPRSHYLLRVFTTPPLRCILMHLSVVGMIYCFAVFPIFGRPQTLQQVSRTDFGRHVMALGRLLAGAADVDHAYAVRKEYMQKVHGAQIAEMPPSAAVESGNPFRTDGQSEQADKDTLRATAE
jgi:hypothetical protein